MQCRGFEARQAVLLPPDAWSEEVRLNAPQIDTRLDLLLLRCVFEMQRKPRENLEAWAMMLLRGPNNNEG